MTRKALFFFKILIVCALVGGAAYFHQTGLLEKVLDWIEGYGPYGPLAFIAVFVLATVSFIPSIIFTFSSGLLFGFWQGVGLSIMGTALGSSTSFLIARYVAHGLVEKVFGHRKEFERLAAISRKKGWKIVLLARFSPIFPFMIGNYFFGITHIKFRHYFLASFVGTIPSACVYVYLGMLLGDFSKVGTHERTYGEWGLLVLGLVATIGLSWYLRRVAQKDLAESR